MGIFVTPLVIGLKINIDTDAQLCFSEKSTQYIIINEMQFDHLYYMMQISSYRNLMTTLMTTMEKIKCNTNVIVILMITIKIFFDWKVILPAK